jgi:hypothetical protein
MTAEREQTKETPPTEGAERLRLIANEVGTLRRLTRKVHSRAGHENPELLRAWMARREAIMDRIAELLPQDASGNVAPLADVLAHDAQAEVSSALEEIQALNVKTKLILRDRAGKIAAQLQQLKAGKKLRDRNRSW